MKKIIIAGGGTGGHIFPAIAIANAIKQQQPDVELLFVGARGKMEMQRVPQAGYEIKGIDIAGLNRSSLIKNLGLPYKLIKSFFQVKDILRAFKPDAVIGVGGYSSYPVLRSAQRKGIPTFIHESNSFAGKANIMLGKHAVKIFVASEGMDKFFPADKIIISGNPVRKAIVQGHSSRKEALQFFGLGENLKTVLVIGGSLGARSINEVISSHVQDLEAVGLQLIWQTGRHTASAYIQRGKSFGNIWVNDFIVEMDKAYAAADLVISRSGAMSVSELCVAKKPVIFVPYPFAAEDHQTVNAQYLVNKDAAILVKDSEVQAKLYPALVKLAMDADKQEKMKNNIAKLAVTNADDVIAKAILQTI